MYMTSQIYLSQSACMVQMYQMMVCGMLAPLILEIRLESMRCVAGSQ